MDSGRRSGARASPGTGAEAATRRLQVARGGRVASMYICVYTGNMSRQYSIAEARARLPAIIDEAEAGMEVELTRRGQPVAVVVSRRTFERLRGTRPHFSDAYERFLERFSLDEIGLDAGALAATRDTTTGRRVTL